MRDEGRFAAASPLLLTSGAAPLLSRCAFPERGASLECAVSGGADSLALLILAVAAGLQVTAYHVDHGLRAGSELDAQLVAAVADRLQAGFVSLRVDVAPGANLEARARAARFAVLPPAVATGHTADDQAETVLINVLRGAGADGLRAMRPSTRHPILRLRRAETVELVAASGLTPVVDATNADGAFQRNRIRHELLPLMARVARRDVVPLLCRQAELLADDVDVLEELAGAIDPTDAVQLSAAPVALARRALRRWLAGEAVSGYPPSAAEVERVLAVAAGSVRACELAGARRVRRSRGRLLLEEVAVPGPRLAPHE